MLYVIIGETNSGKSTAYNELVNSHGFDNVITYTTRPKRPTETNGKEYIFVSEEEFHKKEIVAPRVFNNWHYGIDIGSINLDKPQIVLVDPQGLRDLKEYFGSDKVVGILLQLDFVERLKRGLGRGDNEKELVRRLLADHEDFDNIEHEVAFVINSSDFVVTVNKILSIIKMCEK